VESKRPGRTTIRPPSVNDSPTAGECTIRRRAQCSALLSPDPLFSADVRGSLVSAPAPKEATLKVPAVSPDEFTGTIAVITGGWSQERDRSFLSGTTVAVALTGMGIKTRVLDLDSSPAYLMEALADTELAFLAIAGRGAEDGRLQGLLDTFGIPYTGSGVLTSAVGMNKLYAKTLVAAAGVRVPWGVRVGIMDTPQEEAERIDKILGCPLIVKPVSEGGSIGLRVVTSAEHLAQCLMDADGDGHTELMAEVFHPGRSVSVGVLEDRYDGVHVLPPLEAATANGIYSYAAKRGDAACDYHCPARISDKTLQELQRQAVAAHQALHCYSYSRHDFIVGEDGQPLWLEVNTLPGLSRDGNLARMAKADGLSYEQLLLHILRGARVDRRVQP
jgi:D-alanine-D-alanine ligase